MNFKPVSGAELKEFDAETVKLYTKRVSDERLTTALQKADRRKGRNYLPTAANPPTQYELDRETYQKTFPLKTLAFVGASIWAMCQFSKAYYPYGIILRRSMPQSLA